MCFTLLVIMPTCPNCDYELVLLSYRLKYKCALCSKLYPQKEIDNKEFRKFNEIQKIVDIENIDKEQREELLQLKELKKSIRQLFKNKTLKELKVEDRDKYNELKREYWNKKAEHLNSKRRELYNENREYKLNYQKQWKLNNQHNHRIKRRLADLREYQKQLALKMLENGQYKPSNAKIQEVLPSFVLSHLLYIQ